MKKYKVSYQTISTWFGLKSHEPHTKEIEADSFSDARWKIRQLHPNAVNIIIKEVD